VDGLATGLAVVGALIGWFVLNRWVLPRLGIQT
jgi:p-aminobenzoyl-glutamate transporter AbgT